MLELVYTTQFKKDYKLAKKRNVDTKELFKVIAMLAKARAFAARKERPFFSWEL